MSKEKDIIDSIISQNCHGNERLCQDVKNAINEIAFDTNYTEQERKEAYNTFYTKLLNSTGDDQKYSIDDLCYLAKKKKKIEKKKKKKRTKTINQKKTKKKKAKKEIK